LTDFLFIFFLFKLFLIFICFYNNCSLINIKYKFNITIRRNRSMGLTTKTFINYTESSFFVCFTIRNNNIHYIATILYVVCMSSNFKAHNSIFLQAPAILKIKATYTILYIQFTFKDKTIIISYLQK
jgi:hypothetical protein